MNKTLKILLVCIAILVITISYILYSNKSSDVLIPLDESEVSTTFPGSTESTGKQEFSEIREEVIKNTNSSFASLQMGETFIYNNYAFQVWFDENVGGEALLRRDGSNWELVSLGGGAWEDYSLVSLGVPRVVAEYMVNNRPY